VKAVTNRDMFARMIRCEAEGEGTYGTQAVATVIMNRVHVAYGEYLKTGQGDLRLVLQQVCQFSCYKTVIDGADNPQNIWALSPRQVDYEVADWALSGNVFGGVGSLALWYMNPFVPDCPHFFPYTGTGYWYTRLHDHCFYNPTDAYAET
jgi:N-acetylmuramoyl-L-alanine amidase